MQVHVCDLLKLAPRQNLFTWLKKVDKIIIYLITYAHIRFVSQSIYWSEFWVHEETTNDVNYWANYWMNERILIKITNESYSWQFNILIYSSYIFHMEFIRKCGIFSSYSIRVGILSSFDMDYELAEATMLSQKNFSQTYQSQWTFWFGWR